MFKDGSLITQEDLHTLGQIMVEEVRKEALKDIAKQGGMRTPRKQPEGLPNRGRFKFTPPQGMRASRVHRRMRSKYPGVPAFINSFDYEIVGKATVKITSSWPFIDQLIEGRGRFQMRWLTQEALGGPRAIPIVQRDGTVIVRTAPLAKDAWVHPGFAKHTFIPRGIRKGKARAAKVVAERIAERLAKGDPTR